MIAFKTIFILRVHRHSDIVAHSFEEHLLVHALKLVFALGDTRSSRSFEGLPVFVFGDFWEPTTFVCLAIRTFVPGVALMAVYMLERNLLFVFSVAYERITKD